MGCGQSAPSDVKKQQPQEPPKANNAAPKAAAPAAAPNQNSPTSPVESPRTESGERSFKPIHSAIRWNKNLDNIIALLDSEWAVNCADTDNGNTPLHIAAQNGHLDIIKVLISKNVILNAKNAKGNTSVHMAVGYDYYDCAKLLIDSGADETLLNDAGVPANRGLEGDKSMGLAALISAKTADEVLTAFDLCEAKIEDVNKVGFISAGLKAKKFLGDGWTQVHQDRFKSITTRLN